MKKIIHEKNNNGSCILILTIISSIILLYYINAFRSVEYMQDIAIKKYKYEKHFRATESLYNYGLVQCVNNFNAYVKTKHDTKNNIKIITIYTGPWPQGQSEFFGVLKIFPDNSRIAIESQILNIKSKDTFIIKALLTKEKKISVTNWCINAS